MRKPTNERLNFCSGRDVEKQDLPPFLFLSMMFQTLPQRLFVFLVVVVISIIFLNPLGMSGDANTYQREVTSVHIQPKVKLIKISEELLPGPRGKERQRILVRHDGKGEIGYLIREGKRNLLEISDRLSVELPDYEGLEISGNGKTILRVGEEPPLDTLPWKNFYWLDEQGKEMNRLGGYDGRSAFSLAEDGFTAVGGGIAGNVRETRLGLYSPQGKMIWEVTLPDKKERIRSILAFPRGRGAAVLLTDEKRWLEGNRIQIFTQKGEPGPSFAEFGIIQEFVLLDDGKTIFVQGVDCFGIISSDKGHVSWKRAGKIGIVTPYAAALSPDGKTLFLLCTISSNGKSLTALDALSGEDLLAINFPYPIHSRWDRVFESVSASEICLISATTRVKYSWERNEGVR